MRKNLKYMIPLAISLLLVVLIEVSRPTPIDWSPSFSKDKKIPYGDYLLYRLLPELLDEHPITPVTTPVYNTIDEPEYEDANYIFINTEFSPDELDTETLLAFVENGNTVFIAAEQFYGALADSLNLQTWFAFDPTEDSLRLNFVNPRLRAGRDYVVRKGSGAHTFTSFDTARTTILGEDDARRPTYIRTIHGNGAFYLSTTPLVFTNYNVVDSSNGDYIFKALSYLPTRETYWDEYYKVGRSERGQTTIRYMLGNDALRWALLLTIGVVLLFMAFRAKRRQRIIPIIRPLENTTLEFVDTVGQLYYQHGDHRNIAEKKINYFLEHIRTHYQVKTGELTPELCERVASKSGMPLEKVRELFDMIRHIGTQSMITEETLIALNGRIEEFYSNTRL